MQKFKIKSLTDVITNSSTEVFTIYNKEAVNKIKQMVNSILALSDATSNLTFDDLFEVDYRLYDYGTGELIINLVEKLSMLPLQRKKNCGTIPNKTISMMLLLKLSRRLMIIITTITV